MWTSFPPSSFAPSFLTSDQPYLGFWPPRNAFASVPFLFLLQINLGWRPERSEFAPYYSFSLAASDLSTFCSVFLFSILRDRARIFLFHPSSSPFDRVQWHRDPPCFLQIPLNGPGLIPRPPLNILSTVASCCLFFLRVSALLSFSWTDFPNPFLWFGEKFSTSVLTFFSDIGQTSVVPVTYFEYYSCFSSFSFQAVHSESPSRMN